MFAFGTATHPWLVPGCYRKWMNEWMVRHFGISHLATMAVKSQLVIGVSSTYRSGSGAVSQGQRTDPVMVAPDFKRVLHNTSTAASHLFAIWKQAVSLLGQREAAIVSRHRNQTHDLAIKHRCHGRCRTVVTPGGGTHFCPV